MNLILRWVINALVILIISMIVPGIYVASIWTALIVAVVLGIINVTIRPLILLLTLPINILTLGLFTFIINGLMFWLTAEVVKGFDVAGFLPAFVGALILSLVHLIIHGFERRQYYYNN